MDWAGGFGLQVAACLQHASDSHQNRGSVLPSRGERLAIWRWLSLSDNRKRRAGMESLYGAVTAGSNGGRHEPMKALHAWLSLWSSAECFVLLGLFIVLSPSSVCLSSSLTYATKTKSPRQNPACRNRLSKLRVSMKHRLLCRPSLFWTPSAKHSLPRFVPSITNGRSAFDLDKKRRRVISRACRIFDTNELPRSVVDGDGSVPISAGFFKNIWTRPRRGSEVLSSVRNKGPLVQVVGGMYQGTPR